MQRKASALHHYGAGHPHAPKPARKVITRAPWRPVHRFCSVKTRRRIECESFLERDFAYLLDADHTVLDFATQPQTFEYEVDGVMRTYTPDFLVLYEGHSEIVEVKPSTRLDRGPPWDVVAAVIGDFGYGFRLVTETEISREPRLTNAKLLARYRLLSVPAELRFRLQLARQQHPKTLGELARLLNLGTDWCVTVYGLVLAGLIHADLSIPLGEQTPILED